MSPPHGRTVQGEGQTHAPSSSELGWPTGAGRIVIGRDGDKPTLTIRLDGDAEPLDRMALLNLITAAYIAERGYYDNLGAESAGEDAPLGPPSVAP